MKVSLYNMGDIAPADSLDFKSWPLIESGSDDPEDDVYNPDGFVVAFSLPAPFDTTHIDVVVSVEDVKELNAKFNTLLSTLEPESSPSIPLADFFPGLFDDDGDDDDDYGYSVDDDDGVCDCPECVCDREEY